jgi:hypothetical protein
MSGHRTPYGFTAPFGAEVQLLCSENRRGFTHIRVKSTKKYVDIRVGKSGNIVLTDIASLPNAAGQARAVASRPEPACSRLVCDQCGAEETPPYDEGDACLCGGVFRSANDPAVAPKSPQAGGSEDKP